MLESVELIAVRRGDGVSRTRWPPVWDQRDRTSTENQFAQFGCGETFPRKNGGEFLQRPRRGEIQASPWPERSQLLGPCRCLRSGLMSSELFAAEKTLGITVD